MAIFRRNKSANSPAVPEEVNEYYQAEKRDRTWMAWLLALLSLAVTTLLIMGLFFGGRWVYRKIRPVTPSGTIADNQTNETQNTENNNSGKAAENEQKALEEQKKAEEAAKRAEEEKRKAQERARVNAPVNPAPQTPAPSASGPATTTTPNSANNNLPGTGPGDVIAVFVLTSVAGALVHRYVLRQTNG